MKIIIVGAGIAGLSTYLFLRKHLSDFPDLEIKIYEAYDISKYICRVYNQSHREAACALEQSETEIAARLNLSEEGFNVEAIGSAIGISKNGLDVLSRLFTSSGAEGDNGDEYSQVLADMVKQGHPITRWEMSCARGWTLANISIVPKAWRENESLPKQPVTGIMIGRQAFWSILLRHVIKLAGPDLVQFQRVSEISIPGTNGSCSRIEFADGSSEEADLVIGADGLRSVVRKAMFAPVSINEALQGSRDPADLSSPPGIIAGITSFFKPTSNSPEDYVAPHYEGLVGVGGFVPSSILESAGQEAGAMGVVFGPNGFFGHGFITSPKYSLESSSKADTISSSGPMAVYWSTFSSPDPYPYAFPTTTTTKPKPYEFNRAKAHSAMLLRHRNWNNPVIQAVLEYVKRNPSTQPEAFYPTWTTPELPHWSRHGRVVLVGDAAHTLQPSSGQGASQALEDAEALALVLQHSLLSTTDAAMNKKLDGDNNRQQQGNALETATQNYEAIRMPRVHAIYERSQKMSGMKSDMGFIMEMFMYAIIKIMTLFHDEYNERLVNYDLPKDVERVIAGHQSPKEENNV